MVDSVLPFEKVLCLVVSFGCFVWFGFRVKAVWYGLNLLNNDLIKKTVIANEFDKQYNQNFIKFNNDLKYTVDNMLMNHFEYITFLKEQYES